MKSFQSRLGLVVAGLALVATPALAGQRPHDGGSSGGDHAVERGSGSGGGAAARGGDGGSVATGGSSAGSSSTATSTAPSSTAASPSFGAADRSGPMYAEPQHRGGGAGNARGGGSHSGGGGDHATPRGTASPSGSTTRSGGNSTTTSSSSGRSHDAPARNGDDAVPSWSRPRGDRPASGSATDRVGPRPSDRNSGYAPLYNPYFYDPFYNQYRSYPGFGIGYGYGLGLGWPLFYDPWYDPYGMSGYSGYGGGGGGYGYGGGYNPTYGGVDQGKIRLKVKPRQAKVYVDGYFVGNVDEFDGVFQKLALNGGRHRVEIKADGYETADFDVLITPGDTVTYQGELKKLQ
jgi:hypothetical protein